MKHIWELNWEKKHIIWKVFLHTIWRFQKQSCWGLQQFSNLIQVYWNSVHLLLQNIIINWNIFENSTGKETYHLKGLLTYYLKVWKAILLRSSNSFQIWSKSIEILCANYSRNIFENSTGKRNISKQYYLKVWKAILLRSSAVFFWEILCREHYNWWNILKLNWEKKHIILKRSSYILFEGFKSKSYLKFCAPTIVEYYN